MDAGAITILVLIGVVVGLLLGSLQPVVVNWTMSLTDGLGFVITLGLGYYLSVVFQRRFSEDRAEKELLQSLAKEVKAAFDDARRGFAMLPVGLAPSDAEAADFFNLLRQASNRLHGLEQASYECGNRYRTPLLTATRDAYRAYKNAATERLRSNILLDEAALASVEGFFTALDLALIRLSIHFNRC